MFSKKDHFSQQAQSFFTSGRLLMLMIICGFALYARQYLFNRSFWYDEAAVSLNIIRLPVAQFLHQPMPYNQAAPLGFLLIERSLVSLFGTGEYVLRGYPFVCGVASLWLFSRLARLYLGAEFVILAMFSFVMTPALVYYSSEVKPYCSDVFFLLLSYVVIAAPCLKGLEWKKAWSAGALGALIIWFSYPAIYILFGMGASMLLASVIQKDRPRSLKWGFILFCWLGSLVLYYIFVLHAFSHVGQPGDFWESGFISFDGRNGSLKVLKDVFKYPLGICHQTWLAWVFVLAGGYSFFRKDKQLFFILTAPALLVFLAAGLHLYSWRGRLVLFLVPTLLLLIINGIGMVAATTGKWQRITACLLTGFLFYGSFVTTCSNFIKPQEKQDIRGAVIYAKDHMRPGDVLYVDDGAAFVFEYYHSECGLFTGNYIKEVWAGGRRPIWTDELKKMHGFKRVWVLFPHQWGPGILPMNGEDYSLDRLLKSKGPVLDSFSSAWASVYLFDLTP